MKQKGIFFAVSSALIFGIAPVFADLSYHYSNTPFHMSLFRNLLVLPVLLAMILHRKLSLKLTARQLRGMIVISIFGSAATTVFLYEAYSLVGVGTTTTIHFMYPLLVCLGCHFLGGETLGRVKKISLAVCLCGILFFLEPGSIHGLAGIGLALGSAFSYSFFMIYLELRRLTRIEPVVFSFYLCLIVSLFLLAVNAVWPFYQAGLSLKAYGLMFAAAMGTSVAASILLNKGVALIGASDASVYSLLEPLSGVAAGAVFLGETFDARRAVGCVLILGAVFFMVIYERRKETEEQKSSGKED